MKQLLPQLKKCLFIYVQCTCTFLWRALWCGACWQIRWQCRGCAVNSLESSQRHLPSHSEWTRTEHYRFYPATFPAPCVGRSCAVPVSPPVFLCWLSTWRRESAAQTEAGPKQSQAAISPKPVQTVWQSRYSLCADIKEELSVIMNVLSRTD